MNTFTLVVLVLGLARANAATNFPAFTTLAADYKTADGSEALVKNMPPVRSQDGLNICYGFASWTIYQHFSCVEEKKQCSSVSPDDSFSPLYMSTLGASLEYQNKTKSDEVIPYSADGGNTPFALSNLLRMGGAYTESCYPFDQFVQKHKGDNSEMNRAFEKLRTNFYQKFKTEGAICTDCLIGDLDKEFDLKKDNTAVLKALSEDSFDKFLFDLILKDCDSFKETKRFSIKYWPEKEDYKYSDMIQKIKSVLSSQHPISAGGCLDSKDIKNCKKPHGFVISGYRKYCKPDGSCRDALKIHNSWGQDWQDKNNDGWVDAQTLYDYLNKGKNAFSWITDTKDHSVSNAAPSMIARSQ